MVCSDLLVRGIFCVFKQLHAGIGLSVFFCIFAPVIFNADFIPVFQDVDKSLPELLRQTSVFLFFCIIHL